jgi:hypothetical protein
MNHAQRESSVRQKVQRQMESIGVILGHLQGRGALVAGSIYRRRRRCGKSECRCVQGQLHEDRVLAIRCGRRVSVRVVADFGQIQPVSRLKPSQRIGDIQPVSERSDAGRF